MNNVTSNNVTVGEYSLQARGLGKAYREGSGEALHVLRDINLQLKVGESMAIIGASGSGKTTLLNLLGGLDKPSSGEVLFQGQDINRMDEKTRCKIRNAHLGFVYQFHHLLPEFSALENVAMPLLIGGAKPEQASEQARHILGELGLGLRLQHKPGELSGGERQRAAIARALIHQPDCVFADEPTGNLDRRNAEQVIEIISQLNRNFNTALVIVTHDIHIAERMDNIVELEDGILKLQSAG
jgi:lipoprotein-releasing system ATP-binding protein